MQTQASLFEDPKQREWKRIEGKQHCSRDPNAGPGSCWHWWNSCPKAAQRNCYLLFLRKQAETRP